MKGAGVLGIPVMGYGNRDYGDALIELRDLMVAGSILQVAAGAFVREHALSGALAAGRMLSR